MKLFIDAEIHVRINPLFLSRSLLRSSLSGRKRRIGSLAVFPGGSDIFRQWIKLRLRAEEQDQVALRTVPCDAFTNRLLEGFGLDGVRIHCYNFCVQEI
jgi:hypothetical protein